jgi:hypothetical protein
VDGGIRGMHVGGVGLPRAVLDELLRKIVCILGISERDKRDICSPNGRHEEGEGPR